MLAPQQVLQLSISAHSESLITPNPTMLIVVILILKNFTAFHTMCQPLQASCTSSYPALPKKLLLSSCFLLCVILAAQKYLGH